MDEGHNTEQRNSIWKSPKGLSKGWWRNFIRQAAAAGFIKRTIKTAKFGQSCGVYTSLLVDDKGRSAVDEKMTVLLPVYPDQSSCSLSGASNSNSRQSRGDITETDMEVDGTSKKRRGKGCHLLPLVKNTTPI